MSAAGQVQILVVDDEPAIRRTVRTNLTGHGYAVREAETGGEALQKHAAERPDLILLDLGLPDMDGLDVIREIRAQAPTPIIILSVRDAEREKVSALDLGADDYLTKPFGADELLARIRVALRHAVGPTDVGSTVLQTGDLAVDLDRRIVTVGGKDIHLTPTEYELLRILMTHPNRVITDQMLLRQVWGPSYGSEAHYLHVYVARLRKKLEADPQQPRYIKTEPGVGYRLLADEA
jgi:two-component system, OmpR family, KDP operon response regulator KdpE